MEMVRFEVSNNLIPTFVFTFSRLQDPLKKKVSTVLNTPACAESKNDRMCILGGECINKSVNWYNF